MRDKKDRPKPRESERRLRHNFRLARLLQFLELVSGRGRWNVGSVMKELEVSERTVHRLRETLELAGVPIYFDKSNGSYRVRSGYRFPPLHLTEAEAMSIANAAALESSKALHLPGGARSVVRKIADTSSRRVASILEDARRFTEIVDLKIAAGPRHHEFVEKIRKALVERKTLECRYRSPHERDEVTMTIHPYRLALVKQAWYLIGRPDGEPSPKTFRVVRFESLTPGGTPSSVPDEFDLDAYFGNAWAVHRGDRAYDVELRFSAHAADMVLEHEWHRTQKAARHESGEVTLTFTVDGLNEIVRWIVGWAGQVAVVRPDELRELVVDRHRKALAVNRAKQ
jgi:predicted DNA-binding transcriptional regulator YafY